MKLLFGGFLGFIFLLLFVSLNKQASAQSAPNIWDGTVTVSEIGKPTVQEIINRPDCETKNIKVTKPNLPYKVVFGAPIFLTAEYIDMGNGCSITNSQGTFAAQVFNGNVPTQRISYFSGSNNTSKMYSIDSSNASVFLDPAPSGNNVLMISGVSGTSYKLTLIKDFVNESRLSNGGLYRVEWRIETQEPRLKAVTGSDFVFRSHSYSSNGRYLVVRHGNVIAKIDLETLEMTPVEWRSSWPVGTEIAISNDGRYIFTIGNGMYFYDTSTCEVKFSKGNWENTSRNSYPGCSKSRNFQSEIEAQIQTDYRFLYRPYFEPNSASLNIGGGKRVVASSDLLPQRFDWKEFNIKADSYIPQVKGYIAMGDSFSSGEGDLQGGTWYEPGTDEQGNKDNFEGRNLCHLSRRSYPYLIAKELGYLSGDPSVPVTPSDDSLFHSVACSGAVMRNIVGTSKGILNGNLEKSGEYENQYRNDYLGSLGPWQPGRIKQLDFFKGESSSVFREPQTPEVITIGIGGNDAGFGDIIGSCIMPGTCKYAISGSLEAGILAKDISGLKQKLIETYKEVKQLNSEARIYVHGYPKFAQVGGDCAVNVRLDAQEILMAGEGVTYLNAIVRAAALEAGVYYIDVTDVLMNRNLCSLAPSDQKAFNGITSGNDITNLYLNIGSRGICFVRNGCFGKETFHPNQFGHQLYKQAIMDQSNNMSAPMPAPARQAYPVPSDFFGKDIQSSIISTNLSGGLVSDTVLIPNQQPLLSQSLTGDLNITQSGLLPGSKAELIVQSDPILIGVYDVPQSGELNFDFNLPVELSSGVHEIHLKATDKFGEQIELYEALIIGYSTTDFDGDGIANVSDKCPSIINSSIDADRDGIDDACDEGVIPFVEPPPPPVDPPVQKQTPLQRLISLLKKIIKALTFIFR